jgi:hypothetical protein
LLATGGGFAADGAFVGLPRWDATLLMSLFRQSILARLLDRHVISQERSDEPECPEASAEPPRRRCSPTWARPNWGE